MPLGYEYKKCFIILKEEEKGYEISAGKRPTGYAQIEFKGNRIKIRCFIQNVKSSKESDYRLFLLSQTNKQAIEIGRLRMEPSGRGELQREFTFGKDEITTEYTMALVAAANNAILFGSNNEKNDDWKQWYYKQTLDKQAPKEVPPEVAEEVPKEAPKELAKELAKELPKELAKELPKEIAKEIPEELPKEVPEKAPYYHFFHHMERIEEEAENNEAFFEKKLEQNVELEYKELISVLKKLRKIENITDAECRKWYAIDNNLHLLNPIIVNIKGRKVALSYIYTIMGFGPWIKNSILGIEWGNGYIIKIYIGLPGIYSKFWEQHFKTKGFSEFIRIKGGNSGFWIMCIEPSKKMR